MAFTADPRWARPVRALTRCRRNFHHGLLAWMAAAVLSVHPVPPAHAANLPPAFTETLVAGGLNNPTAMAIAPDGRVFVCEQGGALRVIRDGVLLPTPFVTVPVNAEGERGLLGIAFDPDFLTNQFVYVYYTAATPVIHNRVSRFTADGDAAVPGSESVLLDSNPLSEATNHNGGALHFGIDGRLYIAVGDNANPFNAQSLNNLLGKVLRINADGSIPEDNPFYDVAAGDNRAIWALGLRNPYTFAVQPGTGRLFINDVGSGGGGVREEINEGIGGANYGWPMCEGPCVPSQPEFTDPVSFYAHVAGECAIVGGAFYNPSIPQFPADYAGDYFFGDWCAGWIRRFDPSDGSVTDFATGIPLPVDLRVSPDGSLYYLALGLGAVYRIQFGGGLLYAPRGLAMDASNRTRILRGRPDGRASLRTISPDGRLESSTAFGPFDGWQAHAIGVGSDERGRLLWRHTDGSAAIWFVSAAGDVEHGVQFGPYEGWTVQDIDGESDNRMRLLWTHVDGRTVVWVLGASGDYESHVEFAASDGWTAFDLDVGSDERTRLWWSHVDGGAGVWLLAADGTFEGAVGFGPFEGWTAVDASVGPDARARLLWRHTSGAAAVWVVSSNGAAESSVLFGPFDGWTAAAIDVGGDGKSRLVWSDAFGTISMWVLLPDGSFETHVLINPGELGDQ